MTEYAPPSQEKYGGFQPPEAVWDKVATDGVAEARTTQDIRDDGDELDDGEVVPGAE